MQISVRQGNAWTVATNSYLWIIWHTFILCKIIVHIQRAYLKEHRWALHLMFSTRNLCGFLLIKLHLIKTEVDVELPSKASSGECVIGPLLRAYLHGAFKLHLHRCSRVDGEHDNRPSPKNSWAVGHFCGCPKVWVYKSGSLYSLHYDRYAKKSAHWWVLTNMGSGFNWRMSNSTTNWWRVWWRKCQR